jgi:spore coat polysaccharide biosynthesis protein SpsF
LKVLCIIQARMGSERLPGKVMKKILGKPMISYTLERLKKARYIDELVLATSTSESEQALVDYLEANGYPYFRGSEKNVLERYVDTANYYGGDIIIRVTGDCPLIDPVIVDEVITYFLNNCYDYVRLDVPDTFVRGFDVEIFSKEAMERTYRLTKDFEENSPYKEHVTLYMYKHPEEFSVGYVKGTEIFQKNYRLCVDTPEDFKLVKTIFESLPEQKLNAKNIIRFLDNNPELAQINKDINQRI